MQQLRVLSVNDAKEWLLPLADGAQQIQVAALKHMVLEQQEQQHQRLAPSTANGARKRREQRLRQEESKSESNDDDSESTSDGGDSYVMFRGRILADMDFFDLNSLTTSDFFVFAQEQQEDDDGNEDGADVAKQKHEETHGKPERNHKRKRDGAVEATTAGTSVDQEESAQQLIEMGFGASQVQSALQQVRFDLASAIAILTGDESPIVMSNADSIGRPDTSVRELVRKHPELQVLQPALGELQSLSVQQVAASDVFQALMLLKENVSNESLAQLNANPCAAVQLFRLPPQSIPPSIPPAGAGRNSSSRQTRKSDSAVIDLVDDAFGQEEHQVTNGSGGAAGRAGDSADQEVIIERLTSMGFDRDLCMAMYESCGHDEDVTLNALCEMLH